MERLKKNDVCPIEYAGALDSRLRYLFQNPEKILSQYIHQGMHVLDFGCGPGFFSLPMAKLVGSTGSVVSADIQEEMLSIVKRKKDVSPWNKRISLWNCSQKTWRDPVKFNFILAFYVIHEVPSAVELFNFFKTVLDKDGHLLVVEPRVHVNARKFKKMLACLHHAGFVVSLSRKTLLSRWVLLGLSA